MKKSNQTENDEPNQIKNEYSNQIEKGTTENLKNR